MYAGALGRPGEQRGCRHPARRHDRQAGQHVARGLRVQRGRALVQLVGRHRQDGQVAGQAAAAAGRDLLRARTRHCLVGPNPTLTPLLGCRR